MTSQCDQDLEVRITLWLNARSRSTHLQIPKMEYVFNKLDKAPSDGETGEGQNQKSIKLRKGLQTRPTQQTGIERRENTDLICKEREC